MGCTPSKSNAVHPIESNLSSVKAEVNGSLPENSSATVNGTSNDQRFTTEATKGLESSPNQSNCNEQQNQSSNNKLKESENVNTSTSTTTTAVPACNDSHQLSHAVNNALQHHGNHEYHVLGNQPPLPIPKLPNPKIASSLRTSLRGPGTESQIEFFKMLDRKVEAGPDFKDN